MSNVQAIFPKPDSCRICMCSSRHRSDKSVYCRMLRDFVEPDKVAENCPLKPASLYLCDRTRCNDCGPDNSCEHTSDIMNAKNFKYDGQMYVEQGVGNQSIKGCLLSTDPNSLNAVIGALRGYPDKKFDRIINTLLCIQERMTVSVHLLEYIQKTHEDICKLFGVPMELVFEISTTSEV